MSAVEDRTEVTASRRRCGDAQHSASSESPLLWQAKEGAVGL
ncbi:MAG: hypothetical protein [Podoviridae sp. ctQNx1]|nr:MAG: hypothetical protein [Podoviridae sp. ctQNx1]UOF78121.1 hypothetical protein [Caudoviricetes sp.]